MENMKNMKNKAQEAKEAKEAKELLDRLNSTILIKLIGGEEEGYYVSTKALHMVLNNGTDYSEWINEAIRNGLEFELLEGEVCVPRAVAKELVILDAGTTGRLYRRYLIEAEKAYMNQWEAIYKN